MPLDKWELSLWKLLIKEEMTIRKTHRKILNVWIREWDSKKISSLEALGLGKLRGWDVRNEGNVMILPTHQFCRWWNWDPRNWNSLSKFPQRNGGENPGHTWFLFLCSCPYSRPMGNSVWGMEDKMMSSVWGDTTCLCVLCYKGAAEESLPDKIRNRRGVRGGKKGVITEGCSWPDSFQNVMYKFW